MAVEKLATANGKVHKAHRLLESTLANTLLSGPAPHIFTEVQRLSCSEAAARVELLLNEVDLREVHDPRVHTIKSALISRARAVRDPANRNAPAPTAAPPTARALAAHDVLLPNFTPAIMQSLLDAAFLQSAQTLQGVTVEAVAAALQSFAPIAEAPAAAAPVAAAFPTSRAVAARDTPSPVCTPLVPAPPLLGPAFRQSAQTLQESIAACPVIQLCSTSSKPRYPWQLPPNPWQLDPQPFALTARDTPWSVRPAMEALLLDAAFLQGAPAALEPVSDAPAAPCTPQTLEIQPADLDPIAFEGSNVLPAGTYEVVARERTGMPAIIQAPEPLSSSSSESGSSNSGSDYDDALPPPEDELLTRSAELLVSAPPPAVSMHAALAPHAVGVKSTHGSTLPTAPVAAATRTLSAIAREAFAEVLAELASLAGSTLRASLNGSSSATSVAVAANTNASPASGDSLTGVSINGVSPSDAAASAAAAAAAAANTSAVLFRKTAIWTTPTRLPVRRTHAATGAPGTENALQPKHGPAASNAFTFETSLVRSAAATLGSNAENDRARAFWLRMMAFHAGQPRALPAQGTADGRVATEQPAASRGGPTPQVLPAISHPDLLKAEAQYEREKRTVEVKLGASCAQGSGAGSPTRRVTNVARVVCTRQAATRIRAEGHARGARIFLQQLTSAADAQVPNSPAALEPAQARPVRNPSYSGDTKSTLARDIVPEDHCSEVSVLSSSSSSDSSDAPPAVQPASAMERVCSIASLAEMQQPLDASAQEGGSVWSSFTGSEGSGSMHKDGSMDKEDSERGTLSDDDNDGFVLVQVPEVSMASMFSASVRKKK